MKISNVDLTNNNQKIFAAVLIVATLVVLHWALPPLVVIFKNFWLAFFLAAPLLYCIANPYQVWNWYKQVSWGLTKWAISKDKLGYLYRYHEYLLNKIDSLGKNIQNVSAARVKLQRKISELGNKIESSKREYVEYEKRKATETVLRSIANKINIDKKQLDILLPQCVNTEKQEQSLITLFELQTAHARDFKYALDAKADEYKMLKEVAEATGNAAEFLGSNSEEYKIYQEGLNQLEASVAEYTSVIDNFDRKAAPLIMEMSMAKTVSEDAGIQLINEYKASTHNIVFKP